MTMNVSDEAVRWDLIREDSKKIQSILQFLNSRGLERSLAQLETETEIKFIPGSEKQGSVLDTALDEYWSREEKTPESERKENIFPAPGVCATSVEEIINDVHGTANPTAVCWHPVSDNVVATGAANNTVIIHEISSKKILEKVDLPSPVLSSEWTPSGLYIGCMGGELFKIIFDDEVKLVEVESLDRPHGAKRIVSIRSALDGEKVATAAKDSCIHFFSQSRTTGSLPPLRFQRDVSAMAWIGNDLIVAAEIDNPILSVWKFEIDKWILHSELCMNLSPMDPRTAYTTLAMAWNSQSRILAACTDRNSVLLFSLAENFGSQQGNHMCPVKTLYGMSLGAYDNPNIEFSLDGSHVYITSDRRILVFELRSGHNVFDIMVSESKAIRCMRRHADLDILATVSFDRCLSIIR